MRVTQDASMGTLIGFPDGYLEVNDGATAYSNYVISAVEDYYNPNGNNQASFPQPNPPSAASEHEFPARTSADPTYLPTALFSDTQQLRARAVYTDLLTTAAKQVIEDCFPIESRTDSCSAPNTSTPLEIYPFFDLQMTFLARWNMLLGDTIVDSDGVVEITNEAIATNNAHSRGRASLVTPTGSTLSNAQIHSHSGNLGLTSTGPIDTTYDERTVTDNLFIEANLGTTPVPPVGTVVSGTLRSTVGRVSGGDVAIQGFNALCGQTDTEWSCVLNGDSPRLIVTDYYLNNPRVYVCSTLPDRVEPDSNRSSFALPLDGGQFEIWITDDFGTCQ
jgi:hypothetical protein